MSEFNFDKDVLEKSHERAIVVDYWSPNCGPCRFLGPVLDKLASQADDEWELVKINTLDHGQLAYSHGVNSIPHVKMFSKGKVVSEFVGALPEGTLIKWLDEFLPDERKEKLNEIRERLQGEGAEAALEDLRDFIKENTDIPMGRLILASFTVLDDAPAALESIEDIKLGHLFFESAENVRILAELVTFESDDENGAAEQLRKTRTSLESKDFDNALDSVIEAVVLDKHFSNELPRRGAISIFRMLGAQHPLIAKYRRKFEMALY